jgi:hypothetical protein
MQKNDNVDADSMAGFSHTVHTSSYRYHTTSSLQGLVDKKCTDEIIKFCYYLESEKIKEYLNSNKYREQLIGLRIS